MNENILAANLCGKKIYIKNYHGEKLLFGTVISDWTFEPKDIRDKYTCGYLEEMLLTVNNNQTNAAGWRISTSSEKYIFEKKGIPFDSNTKGWYLDKDLIKMGMYFLDERVAMVMKSE